ncbi:hypothetical protein GYH30_002922 [Glycine max]|uniref:Early nodulin-36B n=1 Tax=Glycine soja TaxID=3848 RepID=A0A445LJ53_GLYSO|nr:hypothetical protein JHK87_002936 [Glycine soja]KAG5079038.1 hypothetical protein JHK86_003103 [Glycine max]KAH1058566.1 hypothetical protein GYH30_002922 [Glycine max]RZC23270.1 Early nodulin-36B [Glycine soja]
MWKVDGNIYYYYDDDCLKVIEPGDTSNTTRRDVSDRYTETISKDHLKDHSLSRPKLQTISPSYNFYSIMICEENNKVCFGLALASLINKGCVLTFFLEWRKQIHILRRRRGLATAWQTGKSQKRQWTPLGSLWLCIAHVVLLAVECNNKQSWSSF